MNPYEYVIANGESVVSGIVMAYNGSEAYGKVMYIAQQQPWTGVWLRLFRSDA